MTLATGLFAVIGLGQYKESTKQSEL